MCRPERALLAPQPALDCGFGRFNFKTLGPGQRTRLKLQYERKCCQNAEKIGRERLRLLQAATRCEAEPARQQRLGETPIGLAAWGQSHPTSHFSAALDQHCPQAVTFSLYECSRVNSRREFRTETRKSGSESDDEDALRCARGSSER